MSYSERNNDNVSTLSFWNIYHHGHQFLELNVFFYFNEQQNV